MACYDLGEFARFHPEGRRVLHQLGYSCLFSQLFIDLYLGAKTRLMQLINHENNGLAVVAPAMLIFAFCVVCVCLAVSQQALLSVQKVMLNNWSLNGLRYICEC